jgi:hypothetical protein
MELEIWFQVLVITGWSTHFQKLKEIQIYKNSLNWLPFPKKEQQRKEGDQKYYKREKMRGLEKIEHTVKYYI